MRMLVLGVSTLLQKRIWPVLGELNGLESADLASRRGEACRAGLPGGIPVNRIFPDYEAALAESDAALVYISTENSAHEPWVEKALDSGRHVIVDKPAALTVAAAARLADLAEARGRCLAECVAYPWHPVFRTVQSLVREHGPARQILSNFSFPPLPAANFRNRAALGGGALHDLAVYTVSPGRILFGETPLRAWGVVTSRGPEVETGYTALLEYAGGRTVSGHFGFQTEYRNHMTVLGDDYLIEAPRVFTPPSGVVQHIRLRKANRDLEVEVPPGDGFAGCFQAVLASLDDGSWREWTRRLRADAAASGQLRAAVLEGKTT